MKMLKLSQRDIRHGYAALKKMARRDVEKCDYGSAMSHIKHCAVLAQQFNWIYADSELETTIKCISTHIGYDADLDYEPIDNRVVVYDDFHTTIILAAQYVQALVSSGKEILYINRELPGQSPRQNEMVDFIRKNFPSVKCITVALDKEELCLKNIYNRIIEFRPKQLLLHIYANSCMGYVIPALPKSIKSYLINLADQTFWVGATMVDYVLEFRQFGVSVSQQRRGISPAQQLLIPFYPVVDGNPFQGFPEKCTQEGKILIFSGGDIYKVLGGERMYWHLVKRLLDEFPEVAFLFATKGDDYGMDFLQQFIKDNHFEERFFYTKFRPDINEIFSRVDIYMGTCPASGSLMSQLAARNATPILQYYYPGTPDDETEQAICVNETFQISYQDEDSFMQEADRLIKDPLYRKRQGKRLQDAMISVEQFNDIVKKSLQTNETQMELKPFDVNYSVLDNRWFALEEAGFLNTMSYIFGLLGGKNCIKYAPALYLKRTINVIMNRMSFFLNRM